MNRTKSAGPVLTGSGTEKEDIRGLCKKISPYIVRQWRDVCEELGVADNSLDRLAADHHGAKMSSLAFQGLCCWQEMVGRSANKEKLLRAIQVCGLRRAEDELRKAINQKRTVPYLGRPATAAPSTEPAGNKQTKQKALADRLSRPKSNKPNSQQTTPKKKQPTPTSKDRPNLLTLQMTPSTTNEICEVKIKITVKGAQHSDQLEIQSTRDDFHSTKDDFKHICHTFVKLVIADQKAHFRELKELLGFTGISVQRLTKVGFNINLFILCFNLGAFEILYQSYSSGRLKMLVQSCLVTENYLQKLKVKQLELSVVIDEGLINKYRDILVERSACDYAENHPVDFIGMPELEDDEEAAIYETDKHHLHFNLNEWRQQLEKDIRDINERYKEFDESVNDLLIILRIVKPPNTDNISSLKDILDYAHYLHNSKSVSKGVRTDLMEEYLAIVNHIRLKTLHIRNYNIYISFEDSLQPDACDQFHILLEELENNLEPCAKFEADDSHMAHALSIMEREMFGGLLCYIPKLISKLFAISDALSQTIEPTTDESIGKYSEQFISGNDVRKNDDAPESNGENTENSVQQTGETQLNGVRSECTTQNDKLARNGEIVQNGLTNHMSDQFRNRVAKPNSVASQNNDADTNGAGKVKGKEEDDKNNILGLKPSSSTTTQYLTTWSPRASIQ